MTAPMPRLSADLTGPREPDRCQSCGRGHNGGGGKLRRWREHGDADRPENIVVVLCDRCADRLIEPHQRLYQALHQNTPWPGCMGLCRDCRFRQGVECTHELQKPGGPGVRLQIAEPSRAHISYTEGGRRKGRWETFWPEKAAACHHKETVHESTSPGGTGNSGRPAEDGPS